MITMQDAERADKEADAMHAAARAEMEKALAAGKQARTLRSLALIWLELQKMNPQEQAGAIAELRRIAAAPNGQVDPHDYRNQAPGGYALYTLCDRVYILDAPINISFGRGPHSINNIGKAFLHHLDAGGPAKP